MFNSFQLNFKTKFHNKTPKVFCLTFGVHVICPVAFIMTGKESSIRVKSIFFILAIFIMQ